MNPNRERILRTGCALLLPFLTCAVQWRLWSVFKPFVWFLFYPTVFFSSRIGGRFAGIVSTIISAVLVVYVFIPPQLTFAAKSPNNLFSVTVFLFMGFMFSYTHDLLEQVRQRAAEAELQAKTCELREERNKVIQELITSEERLRLALDATRDALWDWDVRSGVVFRSPRYYELVRRRPDEDGNRDFAFFITTVHPDDLPHALATIEAHKQGANTAIEFDYRLSDAAAETRWLRVRGKAVHRDETGTPVRIVGTLTDVTERKRSEEEIRQLNITLEERVERRTAELVAANRELDSFAYAVSHDLRAPLRAMTGFSQALLEDYGPQLQGEAPVYLEQIILASTHMGKLIEGLLSLSRSTRGEMRHDVVHLSRMAERFREELAGQEPEREVTWDIEPGITVRGDSGMLEVVMRNLIDNAWKYTRNTQQANIRIYSAAEGGTRRFYVTDNGAGFDTAHSNKLFIPFQRLHRQDEFPGIGIGLATVQRIIHRHGGEIRATGIPGAGATFCFSLAESGHIDE